jgi:hypothetical protein
MSDNPQQPQSAHYEPFRDLYLDLFVDLVNDNGVEMGITISTGGLMVGGTLVGIETWEAGLVDQLTNAHAVVGEAFSQGLAQNQAIRASAKFPPNYIHLRDVSIFLANGQIATLPWWRGRLIEVDGWFLGTRTA